MSTNSNSTDENGFFNFCNICTETLDKYAPCKRMTRRVNQSPFPKKEILRAIMKRTELGNKFLKQKAAESRQVFVKQRNYVILSPFYGNQNRIFTVILM